MDNTPKQYPTHVTIPTPMHTPLLRGTQAQRGPHALGPLGSNLRVRLSRVDKDRVVEVANELGMSTAEFIRWCTVHTATALLNLDDKYETTVIVRKRGYVSPD